MAVVTKKFRLYTLCCNSSRFPWPLSHGRLAIKRKKFFGNGDDLVDVVCGFPLLFIAYVFY
ncbi:hypothetical protein BGW80DRAFT_1380813 [Lactifluus volemus]|nr:hypothetical protein BGW80DRAFT_1380813 [Lactifluus volemus]